MVCLRVGGSLSVSSIDYSASDCDHPHWLLEGYFPWVVKLEMAGFVRLLGWKLPRGEWHFWMNMRRCGGLRREDASWEWTTPSNGLVAQVEYSLDKARGMPMYAHTLPDLRLYEQWTTILPTCSCHSKVFRPSSHELNLLKSWAKINPSTSCVCYS